MQQTVSVVESDAGEWFVFLTIPLGDSESITATVHRTTNGIIAHSEGRRLCRALNENSKRTTHFATVSDPQRASFSRQELVVDVPGEAFRALATEVLR